MAETVSLPAVGEVKKQHLYVAGAAVAGIAVYAYWRAGSDDDEDLEAGELPAEDVGDPGAGPDSYTMPPGGPTWWSEPPDPETLPPNTNEAWTQRAVNRMADIGYNPRTVANALGKYLGRQPLNAAERAIVRTARGLIGPPPVGDFPILSETAPPKPPPKDDNDDHDPKPPPRKRPPKPGRPPKGARRPGRWGWRNPEGPARGRWRWIPKPERGRWRWTRKGRDRWVRRRPRDRRR